MEQNNENILSEETIGFIKKCYIHLNQARQGVWAFADLAEIVWNPKLQKKNKELYFSIIHDAIAYEIIKYEEILEISELKTDFLAFYSKFVSKINTSHEYTNFLEDRITTLENRFGLVWKDQEEQLLKIVSEDEIILGVGKFLINKEYEFINESKDKKKKFIKNKEGKQFTLTRKRGDSFLYFCKELNQLFLLYSVQSKVNVYSFVENHYTKYYPILVKKGDDFGFGEVRDNLLIEGDNYFALQLLQFTHREKIDVIYIDPPYNTGNGDFKYNDAYVGSDDGSRHSKWLSFMEKRLKLARELLTEDGFIFISIDQNENCNLNLLLKTIFGEFNYLTQITWHKGYTKSMGNFFGNTTEYIQVYAKNKKFLIDNNIKMKEIKPFSLDVLSIVELNKNESIIKIEKLVKDFYKKNNIEKGLKSYEKIDENKKLYRTDAFTNRQKTSSPHIYNITNPHKDEPYPIPENGWRTTEETFLEYCSQNRILFNQDNIQIKFFLEDTLYNNPSNMISNDSIGGNDFKKLNFNSKDFSYPKPVSLMKKIISYVNKKELTILDFFAGSGTIAQAVLETNKEDAGSRKFILCTNNEESICEKITYSRLERLKFPKKFKLDIEPIKFGLEYLQIKHISDLDLENADDIGNFEYVKQINNVKFGATKIIQENEYFYITDTYSVFKKSNKNKQKEYCDFFEQSIKENITHLVFVSSDRSEYDYFRKVISDYISTLAENPLFEKIKYYQMSKNYMDNMLSIINGEEEIDVEKYMVDDENQENGEQQ